MDMSSPAPSPNAQVTVRRGDTLIGLVKAHYKGQGVTLDERQAFLAALRVASANGIADAGQIQPGQTVRMESPAVLAEGMGAARRGAMASPSTADVLAQRVQARALYEGGQREGVITRRSLTQGLVRHAQERLSENPPALATLSQAGSTWPQQRQ